MPHHHDFVEKHAFFMALCRIIRQTGLEAETGAIWRSKKYPLGQPISDGFILGMGPNPDGKSMVYKLDITLWDECYFAKEIPIAIDGTCVDHECTLKFLQDLFA